MSNILSLFNGPALYAGPFGNDRQIVNYSSNILELLPSYAISLIRFGIGLFKWTAFFWMPFFVRKYKTAEGVVSLSRVLIYLISGYSSLVFVRGVGRWFNPMYSDFLVALQKAQQSMSIENMENLSLYHFEFSAWPVQYDANQYQGKKYNRSQVNKRPMNLPFIFKPFCYILAHTIGIRMVFPGCTGLVNSLVAAQRRDRLIYMTRNENVKRVKILTEDNNCLEAFYRDNRDSSNHNGQTLVICCEGNAGYPELGNPKIALEQNYSVVGWNHPGFGGSTGLPFPSNEQMAVDAVMKFALDHLQFAPNKILLFGWSIGGYTASYIAMNYPSVGGIVLDATFDDLDQLAEKSLPIVMYPLVLDTVHEYLDLNVKDQLLQYSGPVKFIIRSEDEIIATNPEDKTSNRGYHLLVNLLKHRYPQFISSSSLETLWRYLGSNKYQKKQILHNEVNESVCIEILLQFTSNTNNTNITMTRTTTVTANHQSPRKPSDVPMKYPLPSTGTDHQLNELSDETQTQLLIYLASKYAIEVDGRHCTELPGMYLTKGWSELQLFQ